MLILLLDDIAMLLENVIRHGHTVQGNDPTWLPIEGIEGQGTDQGGLSGPTGTHDRKNICNSASRGA
jgi:hypothetical protein